MPGAWHPTGWWDWCVPEDEKRVIKQFLINAASQPVQNIPGASPEGFLKVLTPGAYRGSMQKLMI